MKLKLITPERTLFSGEVESVEGCAPGGDFEILEGHGAWLSPLAICTLTARASEEDRKVFAVHGGFIEVQGDSVLVLGDIAEAAEEIDRVRAERALSRAKEKVAGAAAGDEDYEFARREMARAEARLEASTVKR